MNCPKCGKVASCKDGVVNGRQRYLCRDCKYRYTVQTRSGTADAAQKRMALELYLEGLGFRSIGRVLKYSHVAAFNWIKEFGKSLEDIKNTAPVEVMELDEMHTYIGSKKTIAGCGLLLIELGKNSSPARLVIGEQSLAKKCGKK